MSIEAQGRYRYYRLSTPDVANALEPLAAVSSAGTFQNQESPRLSQIRFCSPCYDHLAGKVAVEVAGSLLNRGVVREDGRDFLITPSGRAFLQKLGIDVALLHSQRRALARRCLDGQNEGLIFQARWARRYCGNVGN